MPTVSATAIIPASAEQVFAFLADYNNIPKLQPQFSSARLVSDVDKGPGAVVALEGHFHGMPMNVLNRIVTYDPPRRLVSISDGSVLSRSTWEIRQQSSTPDETCVTLTIEYKVRTGGGLFGTVAQKLGFLFHGEIQGMTDASLRKLRGVFDAAQA